MKINNGMIVSAITTSIINASEIKIPSAQVFASCVMSSGMKLANNTTIDANTAAPVVSSVFLND